MSFYLYCQGNAGLTELAGKYSLLLSIKEEFGYSYYYFFLTSLIQFTSGSIGAWSVLCGKVFNNKFKAIRLSVSS